MQVKKFEAKTIKEALQMIKQELGPEAIIINAKDNKKSFGLAGQGSIEVTAAISERSLNHMKFAEDKLSAQDKVKFKSQSASHQKRFIDNTVNKYVERRKAATQKTTKRVYGTGNSSHIPQSRRYIDISEEGEEFSEAKVIGKRVDDVLGSFDLNSAAYDFQEAPVKKSSSVQPRKESSSEVTSLKQEVQQLRELISQLTQGAAIKKAVTQHPGAEYGLSFELSHQFEKLQAAGLDSRYIVEILEKADKELSLIEKKKKSLIDAWVARYLMSQLEVINNWNKNGEMAKLQVFVGPAGHGKTATLIKIASHYVLNEKKRVAILTTDTHKVGALEQLKIFCQILNMPLESVKHSVEFEKLMSKYGGYDVILVDCPGMSLKDISEIDQLRSLLPPQNIPHTTHLVMSATSKDIDGYETAQRYAVTRYDDLILTKVDESYVHGFLYNIQRKTERPLYVFGTGTKIPEDIELATRERVLDLIYKITKNSF